MEYISLYKENQINIGSSVSRTIVVCGWMPKERIIKKLNNSPQYAAVGQLYSAARGINFLIRNLLYNPQINRLILISATREDINSCSVRILNDFVHKGVVKEGDKWKINSMWGNGYIDTEIPLEDLDNLRLKLVAMFYEGIDAAIEGIKYYYNNDANQLFSDAKLMRKSYPYVEAPTNIMPANIIGQRVEGETIAETWLKILSRIRNHGTIRPTGYDDSWQELINLVAVVNNEPEGFYFPEPNYLPVDKEFIKKYIPQMLCDAPYEEGVKYSYGQRMRSWFGVDQVQEITNKIIAEKDTASAVISLWDSGGNINRRPDGGSDHKHSGSPCLNHIWVRVVDNLLTLTATFRSNDMFSAWVSNAMGLRALQWLIVNELRVKGLYLGIGELITISQSAHIYQDSYENADKVVKEQLKCKHLYNDIVGNFIITVVRVRDCKPYILIEQRNKQGTLIKSYSGEKSLKLIKEITDVNPTIEPYHAAYLGLELAKVEYALKNYDDYEQDS